MKLTTILIAIGAIGLWTTNLVAEPKPKVKPQQINSQAIKLGKPIDTQQLVIIEQAKERSNEQEVTDSIRYIPNLGHKGAAYNSGLGNTDRQGGQLNNSKIPTEDKTGYDNSLGDLMPRLPNNQNKGPSNSALRPSLDPSDWAREAAAQDATVTKDASGNVTKEWDYNGTHYETTQSADTHATNVQTRRETRNDGTSTTTQVERREDGSGYTVTHTFDRNYTRVYTRRIRLAPGGNVDSDLISDRPGDHLYWRAGPMHPDRIIDPNSDNVSPEFARWAAQFHNSKGAGAPTVTHVNPGPDGATPNPKAPRLVMSEKQLLGNPDPNNIDGSGAALDAQTAEKLRQQLRRKVAGPGGYPPRPEGD